jgi:predicted CopG family antitoxin
MAVKTITIDMEAYEALARQKRPGQSFSQVIKEQFGPRKSVAAFRRTLRTATITEHTIGAIEGVARSRRKSRARIPTL